jgi:hypothetical protein
MSINFLSSPGTRGESVRNSDVGIELMGEPDKERGNAAIS